MIATNEFKKGLYIEIEGTPYQIVEFQHVKPGKGNAFVRTRMKNLLLNTVLERTFKSGERFEEADLQRKVMQFLYKDPEGYHYLDMESFDQIIVGEEAVGDGSLYLVENMEMDVLIYNGKAISIELPNFVTLDVAETEPAMKGDTVSGGGKPATMTTGLKINVPFHIKQGDSLKIDTRTASYVEKVK